jgi:hypothetical protein
MVRTFVKHSDEAEEFPELLQLARTVFDLCRAVEHLVDRPDEYLRILRKKLTRLKRAVEQFAHDAPLASAHTNFQQAVISIDACHRELLTLATGTGASPSPAADDSVLLTDDDAEPADESLDAESDP